MKKNAVLIVTILFVSVFSAQAGIRFGVKAGVNLANASLSTEALDPSNFTGFQAGLITDFTLPIIGLGMDAALLYSQQGLKFDKNLISELRLSDETKKLSTLDIPVNLKYKFSLVGLMGVYLNAGPYVSFRLDENLKDQYKTKSFGAGLNFGAGVELLNHLQIGANYKLGLTNDYSDFHLNLDALKGDGKVRVWSITAAYFF